jgi:hypothetical protein
MKYICKQQIAIFLAALLLTMTACDRDLLGVNVTGETAVSAETAEPVVVEYQYEDFSDLTFYGAYRDLTFGAELYDTLTESLAYDVGAAVMVDAPIGATTPTAYCWGGTGAYSLETADLQEDNVYLLLVNNLNYARNFTIMTLVDGIPQPFSCGESGENNEADYAVQLQVPALGCSVTPFRVQLETMLDRADHDFSILMIEDGGDKTMVTDHIFPVGRHSLTVSGSCAYYAGSAESYVVPNDEISGVPSNYFFYDEALTHRVPFTTNTLEFSEEITLYYYIRLADQGLSCISFVLVDDALYQPTEHGYYWESNGNSFTVPVQLPPADGELHTVTVVTVLVAQGGSVDPVLGSYFLTSPRILYQEVEP